MLSQITSIIRKIVQKKSRFNPDYPTSSLVRHLFGVIDRNPSDLFEFLSLKNGKKVYLIGEGRIANLTAAEGHPPEVMAQSFSNQLLSILYILKNHKKLPKKVIAVPKEIDKQVAIDALKAMNVKIDKLTKEQIKYMSSW